MAAGAAGVGAITATLKIGVDRWEQATKIAAQTAAAIKSTGGEAHVTAGHVDELATSIMKKSGIDKEQITSSENLLLAFTNVRNEVGKGNDVFDQTTKAAADMATRLGTSVPSATKILGKALDNPTKGIARLTRVGITFTEQQQDQIKALQATGDTLGAQKIILDQVNDRYGGAAAALGKTLPGQIAIAKQSFNDFAEMLVAKLIPVVEDMVGWLRDHWPEISAEITKMWQAVQPILSNLATLFAQVVKVIQDNWGTIGPVVSSLGKIVKDVATVIATALKLVTDLIRGDWSAAWDDLKKIVSAALDAVKTDLLLAPKLLLAAATAIGKAILDGVGNGLTGIANAVEARIDAARDAVVAAAAGAYNAAKAFGARIVDGVVDGLSGIVKRVEGIANSVADAIKKPINAVIAGWNSIVFTVPTIDIPSVTIAGHKIGGGSIGGESIGFPQIPYLAAGGIVTRPTLAMVGEAGPEAVIPLGATGSPVEVRVFIGDTELKGMVRTEVLTQNNRVAQTLLAGLV